MQFREQIADPTDAADHARIGGILLDELAQAYDEIIDRTRGRELIGRPSPIEYLVAADRLAGPLGEMCIRDRRRMPPIRA